MPDQYSTWRAACAAVGDADAAFRLYAEMRANNVQTEVKVYGALISACNQEALAAGGGRRQVPAAMTPRDSHMQTCMCSVRKSVQESVQHPFDCVGRGLPALCALSSV